MCTFAMLAPRKWVSEANEGVGHRISFRESGFQHKREGGRVDGDAGEVDDAGRDGWPFVDGYVDCE